MPVLCDGDGGDIFLFGFGYERLVVNVLRQLIAYPEFAGIEQMLEPGIVGIFVGKFLRNPFRVDGKGRCGLDSPRLSLTSETASNSDISIADMSANGLRLSTAGPASLWRLQGMLRAGGSQGAVIPKAANRLIEVCVA